MKNITHLLMVVFFAITTIGCSNKPEHTEDYAALDTETSSKNESEDEDVVEEDEDVVEEDENITSMSDSNQSYLDSPPIQNSLLTQEPILNTPAPDVTIHTDSNYKYEYRTGGPGDYTYNYDSSATDSNGNVMDANITMNGKYGTGVVVDENGNEKEVDVEWTGYGEAEATDSDGNAYEIEVE